MLSNGTWQPTYEVGTRGCWWKRCCASSSRCLEFRPLSWRCCCLVLRGHVTLEIPKVGALIRQTISVWEAPTPQTNEKCCSSVCCFLQLFIFIFMVFIYCFTPGVTTSQSCASIKPCSLLSIFSLLLAITFTASLSFSLWSFCCYLSTSTWPTQSGVIAVISRTSTHDVSLSTTFFPLCVYARIKWFNCPLSKLALCSTPWAESLGL